MKEFIYSRNAVYETLIAKRRQVFRLEIAHGVQEKGRLLQILEMAEARKIPILRAPRAGMDKIHPGHQGVILEASGYPYQNLADIFDLAGQRGEPPFVLILDTLQDPQNLGTLLRSAEAVGVHGVVLPLARAAGVTPAAVNASSGASEHLLIAQANLSQAIEQLKEAGAWVVGLDQGAESKQPIRSPSGRRPGSGRRERRRRPAPIGPVEMRYPAAPAHARPGRIAQCRCRRVDRPLPRLSGTYETRPPCKMMKAGARPIPT